jgi:hypothetical protein
MGQYAIAVAPYLSFVQRLYQTRISKEISSAHHQRACHALDTFAAFLSMPRITVIIRVLMAFGENLVFFFLPTCGYTA